MFEGVPTMYMYMLVHPELGRFDLSSLTRCTVDGQTMPVAKLEEVERRFGCPLIELCGMTELAGLGTTFPSNGPTKLGSIGIALPYVEARIADADDVNRTMPRGEGSRCSRAEIERIVATHPSVAMVAVGRQPDELKGRSPRPTWS